ncbi:hypothetical protein BH10PSE1_BH10PSE1_12570 [soil metagenome]
MTRFLTMKRLGILFCSLFAIAMAGMFTYQHFVVDPEDKCVAQGRWWYAEGRKCVTPTYLPDITGRPAGMSRAEASNAKNRELIEIEHRLAAEEAARQAATDRARAGLLAKQGL